MAQYDYSISTRFQCLESVTSDGPFLVPHGAHLLPDRPAALVFDGLDGPELDIDEPAQRVEHDQDNEDFTLRWRGVDDKPGGGGGRGRGRGHGHGHGRDKKNLEKPAVFADVIVEPTHLFAALDDGRRQLRRSFSTFRHRLEDLEDRGVLAAGGAGQIAARIAISLPLRLDELLFFRYGLEAESRCVDLLPGMRLQVEFGGYQYVAPPEFPGGFHNGFVGQGQRVLAVGRTPSGMLTFNRFLEALAPIQIDSMGDPSGATGTSPIIRVAHVLDLEADGHRRRHARLIYPGRVPPLDHILQHDDLGNSPVVIAADTRADLDRATEHYVHQGEIVAATTGQRAIRYFAFAGRSIAFPEIPITHQGQLRFVPLGTRLRDLLDEQWVFAPGDSMPPRGPEHAQSTPVLRRWSHPAFAGHPSEHGHAKGHWVGTVQFEPRTVRARDTGLDQWDLPLWGGDAVGSPPR